MDKIIPIRIDYQLVQQIDKIVSQGYFKNRTEGIRSGIRTILSKYTAVNLNKRIIAKLIANFLLYTHQQYILTIYLFGSVATNTDSEYSDIDLLVITNDLLSYQDREKINFEIITIFEDLAPLISLHFETLQEFTHGVKEHYDFETKIFQNGIKLRG